jgi:hypothetical protein
MCTYKLTNDLIEYNILHVGASSFGAGHTSNCTILETQDVDNFTFMPWLNNYLPIFQLKQCV